MDRSHVFHQGRRLLYFSGSDYFRLSWHPAVRAAAARGLEEFGPTTGASRMTTGNLTVYGELESALRRFFSVESATLTSAGYLAPLVAAQALAGRFGFALIDERAHGCLVDASAFLGCPVKRFRHRDAEAAAREARSMGADGRPGVLMTDGVFSCDGSTAPLAAYRERLPVDTTLFVDDSHGAGVLGKRGQGTLEAEGVARDGTLVTITLSKAFGAYGGAVLGADWLGRAIRERSRIFTGNTPLPPPLACAALAGVDVLTREGSALRRRLFANLEAFREGWVCPDIDVASLRGPVFALVSEGTAGRESLRRRLLAARIFPPLIRYPCGSLVEYFRFALCSEHTVGEVTTLRRVLEAHCAGGSKRRRGTDRSGVGGLSIVPGGRREESG